jgi:hypothetical protein
MIADFMHRKCAFFRFGSGFSGFSFLAGFRTLRSIIQWIFFDVLAGGGKNNPGNLRNLW